MTEENSPPVAVLLLNWNRWLDTIECLESLFRQDYTRFSVVICDQASTDGSLERFRQWASGEFVPEIGAGGALAHLSSPPTPKPIAFRVIERANIASAMPSEDKSLTVIRNESNLGSAGGNNTGIRFIAAQPAVKYVWILNNDTVVAPNTLQELVMCAESNPMLGAVSGRLMDYKETERAQNEGGGVFSSWRGYPTPVSKVRVQRWPDGQVSAQLDWVTGGNQLSPIRAFMRVGEIDETYFLYMEDIEHCLRMQRAGLRFGYARDAVVWHKGGSTVGWYGPEHDYYTVRNALHVARRYHPRMMPFVLVYTLYRMVLPKLVRGQWSRIRTISRAYKDYRSGAMGQAKL